MNGFTALTRAQWWGFWRDKQTIFWTIAFPLMFLLLFGSIFRDAGVSKTELVQVGRVALIDQMPTPARAEFDKLFEVTKAADEATATQKVKDGDADGAISMSGNQVVLRFSMADQVKAATVQGTVQSFVQAANVAVSGKPPTFDFRSEPVEDASLKPIEVMTPGLLGWAIAMGAMFGSAMPFVQWRTTKMLRRLRLSPVGTGSLVASRGMVTIAVALLQTALFIAIGMALFGMRLRGQWWLGLPVILFATLAFMAAGLIVGAVSKTPESASGLANLVILPMAFLSGSFIQLDQAPDWLVSISRFMPLRHLNDALTDVMIRGKGAGAIVMPSLVLLGFALVCGVLAARLFRWEDNNG